MSTYTVLVTGAAGMIGSALVDGLLQAGCSIVGLDRRVNPCRDENYRHYTADLADAAALKKIVSEERVDRIIHLAALAHTAKGEAFSWEDYRHLNVDCARNVFDAAGDRSVLFISTVDVFGFTCGKVRAETEPHPVSDYAKSKWMAEQLCRKLPHYTIFRLSPVYTKTIKRDIQKRYYLKYPRIAYQIGSDTAYEVLDIDHAVECMVGWCAAEPMNDVRIIKDLQPLHTADVIRAERQAGRANIVLRFPRPLIRLGYRVLKGLTGENKYTYLLHKAVYPLESES